MDSYILPRNCIQGDNGYVKSYGMNQEIIIEQLSDYPYNKNDGGRTLSKRPKQSNDCTVRSIAIACEITYDTAYDILKEAGRKCGQGFEFSKWIKSNPNINNKQFKWNFFKAVKGYRRMNPLTFTREYKEGIYICQTAKHVFAVVNGTVQDMFQERPDRCIYGCWEVTNREIQ